MTDNDDLTPAPQPAPVPDYTKNRGSIFRRAFWADALDRTVRTFAQALAAFLVANVAGLIGTDWGQALSVSGLAALVALLTSIAFGAVDPETGASSGTTVPRDDVPAAA